MKRRDRLMATAAAFLAITGVAAAQRDGGNGNGDGRGGESTVFTLKLFPREEVFVGDKIEKALTAMQEVADVKVDAAKRRVTLTWKKKDLTDVPKLESACLKAGCPAILWQPLRILAVTSGGKPGELIDAFGLVSDVRKVEAIPGGAIIWAAPTVDLDDLRKAAVDAKASLSITSHEQVGFTHDGTLDTATLDLVTGVVRVTDRDGVLTALLARCWSPKAELVAKAKKLGVVLTEKKK